MMTTPPRRAAKFPRRALAAAVTAVAVLGGLHLWLNTNTFGASTLCGGVVSAHDAEAVLTGTGRITSRPGALSSADDGRTRFDCVIERSAAAQPGSDTQVLFVRGTSERGDFAFTGGGRPDASTVSFFPGGGVASGRAWVQLPAACTVNEAGLVWGNAAETADSEKLVRLLTSTANRISARAGCTPPAPLSAPDRIAPAAEQRLAAAGSVCGMPGFTLPAVLRETVQDSGATWSCRTATGEGAKQTYATFSATQDPAVISGIRKSKGFTGQGFDATHTLSDCSGTPTYFAMQTGFSYTESLGAGAPAPQELFTAFTKAAAAKFGCAKP
ncbi:hypothetical protein [Streptomyces sp. NPDC096339]|uniref:hypothetical protein n=1 Tax=Streptomyces sp. NPDC096339 TaxID=3366086 RepID=UPI003800A7F4